MVIVKFNLFVREIIENMERINEVDVLGEQKAVSEHRIIEILGSERAKDIGEYFELKMREVCEVGDIGLRKAARDDLEKIGKAEALEDFADPQEVERNLTVLGEIISGGSKYHSLFTKLRSVQAFTRVCLESGMTPGDTLNFIVEAANTEPEQGGKQMLLGAFCSELEAISGSVQGGEELLDSLNQGLLETVKDGDDNSAINVLGIRTCAETMTEMVREGSFRLRYPERVLRKGGEVEEREIIPGRAEYPHRPVFLGDGRLATYRKHREAVSLGVPRFSDVVLENRFLRIFMGMEIDLLPSMQGQRGRFEMNPKRRFMFVYLQPLVRPDISAANAFENPYGCEKADLMEKGAFDAMNFNIAIRVARKLGKEFGEIDRVPQSPEDKELGKVTKADEIIDVHLREVRKVIRTKKGAGGGKRSENGPTILGLAIEECKQFYKEEWGVDEALEHIRYTSLAFALERDEDGRLRARSEESIRKMYADYVWGQLAREDKIEMAMAILESCGRLVGEDLPGYWRRIAPGLADNTHIVNNISGVVFGNGTLSAESESYLLDLVNGLKDETIQDEKGHGRKRWCSKAETFRNKRGPLAYAVEDASE